MKAEYEETINRGLMVFALIVIISVIVWALSSCTTIRYIDDQVTDSIYQFAEGGVWIIEEDTTYKWK